MGAAMTRLFIEGQSDSPVTIPTNPPITVNPINNAFSRRLSSQERDQLTIGQTVTLTSDGRTTTFTVPDYTDLRPVTITPAAGTTLVSSIMNVSATPLSADWRYSVRVLDATNTEIFNSGAPSQTNTYNVTGLPIDGQLLQIEFTVDKDDGQGPQIFTREVTAFSGGVEEPPRNIQILGPFTFDGSTHVFTITDDQSIPGVTRYDIWIGDKDYSTATIAPEIGQPITITATGLPTDGQEYDVILRVPAGYFQDLYEPVTARFTAATSELYPINLGTVERPIGSVTDAQISTWFSGFRASSNEDNLGIVIDNGEPAIRHEYEPTFEGSDRVVLRWDLPHQRTYRLRESAFFEKDYQWGRIEEDGRSFQSAKFGFGFGGGSLPSGGQVKPDGFTARLNVHGEHLGGNIFSGQANLVSYAYRADRDTTRGQIDRFGPYLPKEQWFTVVIEVEVNSNIALSDGSMRVWYNGELVFNMQNIQWWKEGATPRIDTLYYSSFFGGNGFYAPPRTVYARFKNIAVAPVINGNCAIQP